MAKSEGGSSWWQSALMAGANAVGQAITAGGPKRQYKYAKRLADYQQVINRGNAEWMLEQEKALTADQRLYDSPAAQMARFKEAGLNPNLIYGEGTAGLSQSMHAPSHAGVGMQGINFTALPAIGEAFQRARLLASQADLNEVRVDETESKTRLNEVKKVIAEANPYLRPGYLDAVQSRLESLARLKEQESSFMLQKVTGSELTNGEIKMQADIDRLHSQFDLNRSNISVNEWREKLAALKISFADVDRALKEAQSAGGFERAEQIRAQRVLAQQLFEKRAEINVDDIHRSKLDLVLKSLVMQSESYNTQLKEVELRWLRDGQITPEHIRQAFMKLLDITPMTLKRR